ncbi:uncharacterized protein [Embiotoca jacksoni]|uniref:uncharacterized protein n=1 Tax=Embiotoca jacksoni TaxID=100190 RepID=UPI003704A5EF
MSFTTNPTLVPDRDSLPLKKRDQRPSSPLQQQQQQQECDAAHFKAPYPYKSRSELKTKPTSLFQPVPRRVPALYQPWMQTPTRSKPHALPVFREHHGWAEWSEFSSLHPGWDFSHHYQHQSHLCGTPALHLGHPHYASRVSAVSLVTEGYNRLSGSNGWEKTLRDKSLNPERQSYGRHKGPYVRKGDRKTVYFPSVEKASPLSLSTCLPQSPYEDLTLQQDSSHKSTKGHSFIRVCPDNTNSTGITKRENTSTSPATPSHEHASSSSASPDHFPWLLPHFVAGSLIELRDGRLRRVEHLQTEDFLLGSLACPDLCLSCCTVQSISPSASSSTSRLLILLHDQQSQELVDVYVEYPFFVRGHGWSSCSPQRTTHLCGLQCRQLSVGDVCLALTPISPPQSPSSVTLEPKTSSKKSEGGCEPLKASPQTTPYNRVPSGPKQHAGGQKMGAEAVRRRHYSAPELRGPGTNCM